MSNVDVNKPVENPNLRALFDQRASADTPEKMNAVMNSIFDEVAFRAHFLVIAHVGPDNVQKNDNGTVTFKPGAKIGFQMIQSNDNKTFLPVFTDWQSLRMWEPFREGDVSTFIFGFEDICAVVTEEMGGAVINPFSDNLGISRPQLMHIKKVKDEAATVTSHTVQEETKVLLGDPSEFPHEMVNAINDYAKTNKAIKAIYLKVMVQGNDRSFLLTVDAKGEMEQIVNGLATAARPYLPEDMRLSFVEYESNLGKQASDKDPIYKRKGLFF